MKGNNMENEHDRRRESRKWGKELLLLGFIIGLIIGIILTSYVQIFFTDETPETPIHQQYNKFEWISITYYYNEQLNVTIKIGYDNWGYPLYVGEWIDINGNLNYTFAFDTLEELLDTIFTNEKDLSDNQLKWFDYMLNDVVD